MGKSFELAKGDSPFGGPRMNPKASSWLIGRPVIPFAMEMPHPAVGKLKASRYFLKRTAEGGTNASSASPREDPGVLHFNNGGKKRGFDLRSGGYSGGGAYPVVVRTRRQRTGRAFLWLAQGGKNPGIFLISPTARGDTWSIRGPDVMAKYGRSGKEPAALELTATDLYGHSDGGPFSPFMSGLGHPPFHPLGPIAASFHV
ncbi:MAG: hypothetical protein CM15mP75_0040 [Flammeovirgaceae bacterium]|nr:MAG: hypothetical protein CM15mP75_0040 [Flammeovirgaceae bacterium]